MLFEDHLRPFSGFEETVDLYPLFWCTFSQISRFLMILVILIGKMNILDHFWGPLTASCPKVTVYLPLSPSTLSGPAQNLLFWPNFASFWTPFEGPERRLRLGPLRAAFWLEDLFGASQTHTRDQILVILTTFPIAKVNFCHFAYQGSVKMPFWPYFDPFEPSWAQTFGLSPKCAYLGPLPWRALGGPSGT